MCHVKEKFHCDRTVEEMSMADVSDRFAVVMFVEDVEAFVVACTVKSGHYRDDADEAACFTV